MKLKAAQLRTAAPSIDEKKSIKRNPIYIVLDSVMDTYNVGAIFRLADAAAAQKIYLCGSTEIPPNTRIKKASINTTEWVDWEYSPTAVEALQELKSQISNLKIVAVEQDPRSIPFDKAQYSFPIALVVGHETEGVSKEVLDVADTIVELPMYGINKSLNVMVSLGIVLYKIMEWYGENRA